MSSAPLFTCQICQSDVFSLVNGADQEKRICGRCLQGNEPYDSYLGKYTEHERYLYRARRYNKSRQHRGRA